MLRATERECVMCRKHGEAIKPAGKNRLEYGSNFSVGLKLIAMQK